MLSLKNVVQLRRKISEELDQLYATENASECGETCPYCDKESTRVETMETMNESGVSSRIGFFTCRFCDRTWSHVIDG